ncbi:MAG: hypothetical protein QOJ80_4772 [Mycobacterium sp.]|nr:hypothetical protein [Mycobacterium sp.]
MLGLHSSSVVPANVLIELLWDDDPPRTAAKALQTHISALRRALGDGFVLTEGAGWALAETGVDASSYKAAARLGRAAAAAGDTSQAVVRFEAALALWRGTPELPDGQRGSSEKTRWIETHAALVEDRADALLASGRAAELIGELEAAVADTPLRERRWGQLMLALYRAGRQGEALAAYQRARSLLADQLGVDPGPDLRRLEAAIVVQDEALDIPVAQHVSSVTRAVTFLLTDIEGSTAAWEADTDAMGVALARHDELVEHVVTSRGGRLIKTRGEGDATFSVFDRPSAAAAAAIELQDAVFHEPWGLRDPMRIRVALHTGEVELRDGDYFGRAVNRAARLRSLAAGGQILCSGATAELVIDSLADDVALVDLGMRQLRNLPRPEHVFELRLETTADRPQDVTIDEPVERPELPSVLTGPGPFVGRGAELAGLLSAWQTALTGGMSAVLIAGEPGVGKTRLAGEWSTQAYEQGAFVLYGRCDEDLGAPYQPFAEALRALVPCLGANRLQGLRGVEALLPLVPGLADVVPDLAAPTRADPDTERYALFDAAVALLDVASTIAPVVLVLDDLHWAAKPTLLLLRHLLRFGERAHVQIVGTYRSTDLDRSHPLAAMLADLHRDGTAHRLQLSGLDEDDVTTYVAEAGYDDEELARALALVTGGNPFFLIEALRHVDESGGVWDQSTLPQGVREAVSRRLSRLPADTNKALAAAAVVGSRFAVELVERVVDRDLVDAFDEACKAGIIIEEPGGHYRFNHALVRQSLLAELPSVRRMRLHQRIAATLENEPGAEDELLAELAHHYFECAWAGNAAKAVEFCRRAADQAMARLAYEGAADLYDHALHALEELDDELPNRDDQTADLLVVRCEALLAAGDVASAAGAVAQLQEATHDSARRKAWATCFDGQLSMLIHPERLDEVELALGAAANELAGLGDAAGEATAHTVRAACLARLGRIADCEVALDQALTAARRTGEHRRVNAVLAGAPLASLWGPNPVARAGGRCLDVVRLLRITTDSPAVEATSTRCQAVLEAFRGRSSAARRMIESAQRTVAELGLRHARLEVEQFAGIVELVADDPTASEPHLRKAYNGFRRMGLDADTAETAALLGRACLALDRDVEADELCAESERLAGHALKASISWRTLRAQLLSRSDRHDEARAIAEAAVTLAERTDALVDHGDACLALATVLDAAGDAIGARAAAQRAIDLYQQKGASALAEKARCFLGDRGVRNVPAQSDEPTVDLDNACVGAVGRLDDAAALEAWSEVEQVLASNVAMESRRRIVGFPHINRSPGEWVTEAKRFPAIGVVRVRRVVIAVRGERLALVRTVLATADESPGAAADELLHLLGLDDDGRIALQMSFDVEDIDAALAELDAAYARFEAIQPQPRRMDNAANRVRERYEAHIHAREWDAVAKTLAEDFLTDDRRRVVNGGVLLGRDAEIANVKFIIEAGARIESTAIATRGDRLVLTHHYLSVGDGPEAIRGEFVDVVDINAEDQLLSHVVFDPDDIDAAFEELDARYLAGEAADYARIWQLVIGAYESLGRQELPAATQGWTNVDHRRVVTIEAGDLGASLRAVFNVAPAAKIYLEAVHAMSNLGAVVTHVVHGTSQAGFDAEWREVSLLTFEGNLIDRCEVFDEADADAAIARFDELSTPTTRLENAASRVCMRLRENFVARNWDATIQILADDVTTDDRRRVVNAGVRQGRDAVLVEIEAAVGIGVRDTASDVIATRGERLVLSRFKTWGLDKGPDAFHSDVLEIVELNVDEKILARLTFDPDDFDSALAELDARYLAGEAATHARTWTVITGGNAALNRRELQPAAPDCVSIDHRRGAAFASGEMEAYLRAGIDLDQNIRTYIEVVHRLSDLGAVFTHAGHGVSHEGFDAEWRGVDLLTVEGETVSRAEIFDEADLAAAIARFDELSRPSTQLENATSRAADRYLKRAVGRDWDAIAEMLADDYFTDDRRHLVGGGIHGRDAEIASVQAQVDLGVTQVTPTIIATRGERLALSRVRYSSRDQELEAFVAEMLIIFQTNADGRFAAAIAFDIDEIDAALAELDARYLADEAADSQVWPVVAAAYAAVSRRELPPTIRDCENIDHRRSAAFAPGDLIAYIHAGRELDRVIGPYIEVVHRLTNRGAVITYTAHGTSSEGFDAEWREVTISMVEGDLISRCELFDEADLEAALAKFDELSPPVPQRLENAASRVDRLFWDYFGERDWAAIGSIVDEGICVDDRRRVVSAGIAHGRAAHLTDLRAIAGIGAEHTTSAVVATRGASLALTRVRSSYQGLESTEVSADVLCLVEIGSDNRIVARVGFDLDDIDAAFEELDARYLVGEAADHAHMWSAITDAFTATNRHELPATTPDYVIVDHRLQHTTSEASGLAEYLDVSWDLTPELRMYIETVHQLSDVGAVFTLAAHGASRDGFDAEWRLVEILTGEGQVDNRCEIFDEADLDAALARFEELQPQARRLENTAGRVCERFRAQFAERDWQALAGMFATDFSIDDRRRVVNAGVRHGRDAEIDALRAVADLGITYIAYEVIATRGERLILGRVEAGNGARSGAVEFDVLQVIETDEDGLMKAVVMFDVDDIDVAFEELDARYLAGEAAAHARTWSAIAKVYADFNLGELPAADWVAIDNRRATPFDSSEVIASIRTSLDVTPDLRIHIETVQRLNEFGAVLTNSSLGTSVEGFPAEWRMVQILTVEGDRISRLELFDEDDLATALAKFDELLSEDA